MRNHRLAIAASISLLCVGGALAQQPSEEGVARNLAEMKFAPVTGLPTCVPGAIETGDPTTGPFVLIAKIKAGCSIPWHWHSANEQLMVVDGSPKVEMKGEKPVVLRAGGFARLPAKHAHQVRCEAACTMFVTSDGKFDIHYIDQQGTEIPAEQALKPLKETVTAMK